MARSVQLTSPFFFHVQNSLGHRHAPVIALGHGIHSAIPQPSEWKQSS